MTLLAFGFVVFCIGGTVFKKGEPNHSPRDAAPAISLGVHALNFVGVALILAGGFLMLAAGIV